MYERLWLIVVPVGVLVLLLITVGARFSTALFPRDQIAATNLPDDVELTVTLQPSIDSIGSNSFLFSADMKMGILENSSRQLDYFMWVLPGPVTPSSGISGFYVAFSNLVSEGQSYTFYSNGTVDTFESYSYQTNMSSTYVSKNSAMFPGDFYVSSTIYIWFGEPFYPNIKLSPASSLPTGFIAYLSNPVFIKGDNFYRNIIPPFDRLVISMPSSDVMAFQIIIQRDNPSLVLYSVYTFILLYAVGEVLVLSHIKLNELRDRLSIFVGLAIASVAFLWSVRQVTNVISWPEVAFIVMLGFSISLEVIGTFKSKKPRQFRQLTL